MVFPLAKLPFIDDPARVFVEFFPFPVIDSLDERALVNQPSVPVIEFALAVHSAQSKSTGVFQVPIVVVFVSFSVIKVVLELPFINQLAWIIQAAFAVILSFLEFAFIDQGFLLIKPAFPVEDPVLESAFVDQCAIFMQLSFAMVVVIGELTFIDQLALPVVPLAGAMILLLLEFAPVDQVAIKVIEVSFPGNPAILELARVKQVSLFSQHPGFPGIAVELVRIDHNLGDPEPTFSPGDQKPVEDKQNNQDDQNQQDQQFFGNKGFAAFDVIVIRLGF